MVYIVALPVVADGVVNDIKNIIPRMFEVKIAGILNLNDINRFVKSGANLAATTIDLKVNYKEE